MKKIVFLKSSLEYISVFWSKLAVIQKIAFTGIILAVIGGVIALFGVSSVIAKI